MEEKEYYSFENKNLNKIIESKPKLFSTSTFLFCWESDSDTIEVVFYLWSAKGTTLTSWWVRWKVLKNGFSSFSFYELWNYLGLGYGTNEFIPTGKRTHKCERCFSSRGSVEAKSANRSSFHSCFYLGWRSRLCFK